MKYLKFLIYAKYSNRRLFVAFLMIITAQLVDAIISQLADSLKNFAVSIWGVGLFIGISIAYGFGQYFILGMVNARNKEKEIRINHFNILESTVTIVQYILLTIMVLVILQIIFSSEYYTILLTIAAIISGGLTMYIMSLLSYSLFSWFRISRAIIVLLFGLAATMITFGVVAVTIIFSIVLQEKAAIVTPDSDVTYSTDFSKPGTIVYLVNTTQGVTWVISFLLIWCGTILLLRHNFYRIGKVKFWVLVSTPMAFYTGFYLFSFQLLQLPTSVGSNYLSSLLVVDFSSLIAFILIGAGFRTVAKALSHTPLIRDYMMINAYGFILFLTTTNATVSAAGYPPFGLANILLYAPFSFLILTGLYRSAVCVSEDLELRKSIKTLAKKESKLLDITASAEVQREIQNKVMTTIKSNAESLEKQTGVESSLTDAEIQNHLEVVTKELRKQKQIP